MGDLGAPASVRIVEVGPRDGLQNESRVVPTPDKAEFIRLLSRAGLTDIEATSFVRPDRIPQLADAEALLRALGETETRLSALVPNMIGLERAIASGLRRIAVLTSASDTFNRRNINMDVRESLDSLREVVARARREELTVRGYVSTAWVCPYEGRIDPAVVVDVVGELLGTGVEEISVGDTIGAAAPTDVERTLGLLLDRFGADRLAVHFHDTYGMALANACQAWRMGVARFDSSAGGLGGCPYAPGAAGNVATEDLVFLFDRMGVETGIRLGALRQASEFIGRILGHPLPSRVLATPAASPEAQE